MENRIYKIKYRVMFQNNADIKINKNDIGRTT